MKSPFSIVDVARLYDDVREVPPNRGLRVEAIQHWSGGASGDSWCAEMAWLWLDRYFKGQAPIDRFQAVEDFHLHAMHEGWMVDGTQVRAGDFYLYLTAEGHAHHIGLVTQASPLVGIAGNTSSNGTSSNGTGVFEHPLSVPVGLIAFVRVPGVEPVPATRPGWSPRREV